jgi:hypothetical protein
MGFATRLAALDLDPAAALLQIPCGLLLGGVADLDVVHHLYCARRLGHPRGGTFVLDHVGGSVPIGHAALDAHGKSVLADHGLGQTSADFGLDLSILCRARTLRFGLGLRLSRGARQREQEQADNFQHAGLVAAAAQESQRF